VRASIENVYRLGLKELISLRHDVVLVVLICYFFSYAVYAPSKGTQMELVNASVAVVDEDQSVLSRRIIDALLPPFFRPPARIGLDEIDAAMDSGRFTFVLDIPPDFQADVERGRRPTVQLNVDATAVVQAGHGAQHIQSVVAHEVAGYVGTSAPEAVKLVTRTAFNPNRESSWFAAVMQVINNITLLAIFLSGAALIREREQGTIEHLLVMPLGPAEIMLAKIWANALVVAVASGLSLRFMVQGVLEVPIVGSLRLFVLGELVYLFAVTSLGIFLATLARSMPQFALLAMPVFIVMNLLSGSNTPFEAMPVWVQQIMLFSPSSHFVAFAQSVLYRGAGLDVVWPEVVRMVVIGAVFFAGAWLRFRRTVSEVRV
jgi:ABC-2 type transport system permease protein